jgi:hypothetical protein
MNDKGRYRLASTPGRRLMCNTRTTRVGCQTQEVGLEQMSCDADRGCRHIYSNAVWNQPKLTDGTTLC